MTLRSYWIYLGPWHVTKFVTVSKLLAPESLTSNFASLVMHSGYHDLGRRTLVVCHTPYSWQIGQGNPHRGPFNSSPLPFSPHSGDNSNSGGTRFADVTARIYDVTDTCVYWHERGRRTLRSRDRDTAHFDDVTARFDDVTGTCVLTRLHYVTSRD